LPKDPKARARVRGLAQIIACDTHPLIVPRVREYLAHEYKVDEAGVLKWGHHWHVEALKALEANLAGSKQTGRYCQGDQITIADICLAGQAAGSTYFKVNLAPFPTVKRIVDTCMANDAFARAHPMKQPGAPAPT
jgi:maleylacetoacetate isomerase